MWDAVLEYLVISPVSNKGSCTNELSIIWTGMDGVYEREWEFSFRNVFT